MDGYEWLLGAAAGLNQYEESEPPPAAPREAQGGLLSGTRPGDDFNRKAAWPEVLERHGWKSMGTSGDTTYWRRPGKTGRCWSATTGKCHSDLRGDLLYVFSTSAAPFDSEKAYSKFEALALLEHGGDYRKAAERLAAEGYGAGRVNGRVVSNGRPRPHPAEPPPAPEDAWKAEDATAADLIRVNSTIRWTWEGWIPVGALTILASEPGVGKTRLCADLLRRVHLGLSWPDGKPPNCEKGSRALWVAADNQHPELGTLPGAFKFPPEALFLNATRGNPFAGTMLDTEEDRKDFEDRVTRVKPVLVFIDTSLNATDRSAHKPEDAKAFFKPLQEIAARQQTAIVCVTHLNAAGKPLGRRVEGQGRVVVMLERPDPEGQPLRRRLYVRKSHSMFPPALGVTMGPAGNDYDDKPPEPPSAPEPGTFTSARQDGRLAECLAWLAGELSVGARLVGDLRSRAEKAGFDPALFYRAGKAAKVTVYEARGKKWWCLGEKPAQGNT